MSRAATSFRRLLSVIVAFALTLSVAAWGAHSVTHGLGIAVAERHGGPGDAAAGTARKDSSPDRDKQDGGHDHLLGLSFMVAALSDEIPLNHPQLPAPALSPLEPDALAVRAHDPPPLEPPRPA
jgi:hypothetical protein